MTTPHISICLPAYNARRHLPATLAGVRAQTFPDWELIVIEDGSAEDVASLVRDFAAGGPQAVSYLQHASNQGLPAARNTAIAAARGDWIALLDADDVWLPAHLAALVSRARANGADVLHTAVTMFDSDTGCDLGVRAPGAAALADFPVSLFHRLYPIQPSSVLIRRATLQAVGGFDAGTRYVEDFELWMRLVRADATFAFVPEATCRYRQHAGAMTRHGAAMALGLASVYERNTDWPGVPSGVAHRSAAHAWLSAGRILLRHEPARAADCFRRSVRHRPASPVAWCYLLTALLFRGPSASNK